MPKKINFKDPQYRLQVCQEYLRLWGDFFQFIDDDMREKNISPDDEKRLLQYVSALSAKQYIFAEIMGEDFKNADGLLNILNECVSCSYVKTLPEAHFSKLQNDWHSLFIEMNKCIGRIMRDKHFKKKKKKTEKQAVSPA